MYIPPEIGEATTIQVVGRRACPERVNDFATPVDVNLVCGRRVFWSVFSPQVAG